MIIIIIKYDILPFFKIFSNLSTKIGTNVDKRFDDIWSFDLVKFTWTELKVEGIIPEVFIPISK